MPKQPCGKRRNVGRRCLTPQAISQFSHCRHLSMVASAAIGSPGQPLPGHPLVLKPRWPRPVDEDREAGSEPPSARGDLGARKVAVCIVEPT
jgi:hypothetical protein